MRVQKLEAIGFKSFKDKTFVYFHPTITGVVGPNGCGKSNIVDAILWVMGEMSAKHLRGQSMSDLIFMGSENYASSGFAEVSLFLENDGGPFPAAYSRLSEMVITRRLHRNGESEYLINNQPVLLRDIHEVFMDTGAGAKGFSIIEQGAVSYVVTAKPEERRVLIEEAAGITKFRVRKKESERKLKSTEENLIRLQDILSEQKRQLASLERQSQKAEKYRDIKTKLEEKEIWLNSQKFLQLKKELEESQKEWNVYKEKEEGQLAEHNTRQMKVESLKHVVGEKERDLHTKQEELETLRQTVVQKEKELRELEFEMKQAERDEQVNMSFFQDEDLKKKELEEEKKQLLQKQESLHREEFFLEDYGRQKESFLSYEKEVSKKEDCLEALKSDIASHTERRSHLKAKIEGQEALLSEKKAFLSEKEEKLKSYFEEREAWSYKKKKCISKLEKVKQMRLEILNDSKVYDVDISKIESEVHESINELDGFKKKHNEVSGQLFGLESLQEAFEGFEKGARYILGGKMENKKDFTPLLQDLEVPQKFEKAVECTLNDALQILLADSLDDSLEALKHLKTEKLGRCSFLSQDMMKQLKDDQEGYRSLRGDSGFVAFLSEQVKNTSLSQVSYLLRNIVVVTSLDDSFRLRDSCPECTFVTLEGEKLHSSGVLTGGFQKENEGGLLRRKRKIKELLVEKNRLETHMNLMNEKFKKLKAEERKLAQEKENLKKLQSDNDLETVSLKKDMELLDKALIDMQKHYSIEESEMSDQKAKFDSLLNKIEKDRKSLFQIEETINTFEKEKESLVLACQTLKAKLHSDQKTLNDLELRKMSYEEKKNHLETQIFKSKKDFEQVLFRLNDLQTKSKKNKETCFMRNQDIKNIQSKLDGLIGMAKKAETLFFQARERYEKTSQECRLLEDEIYEEGKSLSHFQSKLNEFNLRQEQAQMKMQHLIEQTEEKYSINLSERAYLCTQDYNQNEIAEEVIKLKKQLAQIGEVNLVAFKEREETKERYEFLEKQYEDLVESKNKLNKVIEEIDKVCTRRFKESYEKINKKFQEVFPILFDGGRARLCLVENLENPHEPGIGIEAQPEGKKLQNISLLSGGEKALTAISLIFSIFLIKPSPFCLLDEVDAPLDDVNVMRFNDLVKQMAKRSQVILITHNKYTMKVIDKIYGVTMEEKGVSKLVSVELEAAEKWTEEFSQNKKINSQEASI